MQTTQPRCGQKATACGEQYSTEHWTLDCQPSSLWSHDYSAPTLPKTHTRAGRPSQYSKIVNYSATT